jgi:hypothetical protein
VNVLGLIQIRLTTSSFEEILLGCQGDFYLGHFTYGQISGWLRLGQLFGLISGHFTYENRPWEMEPAGAEQHRQSPEGELRSGAGGLWCTREGVGKSSPTISAKPVGLGAASQRSIPTG